MAGGWKLRALKDPTHFYVVAYEQTTSPDGIVKKQIVGWTSWNSAPPPGTEKSAEEKEREEAEEVTYRPEAMDKEEQERIAADIKVLYKQCYGEDEPNKYWILQVNCVHPSHQRKGVASKMVKWGITEAAKNGKGVVVISTPMGRPFYVSVGFEAVAEMYIRNEAFPGMIIRPPQASAT
ncbi:hypothetical protein BR93DRAFT_962200 [Coniochaeta sp. PMI_546]|nr:hypothetical protein BR93DRAFT_962200 [Coniochaeta sp. PMI_546]